MYATNGIRYRIQSRAATRREEVLETLAKRLVVLLPAVLRDTVEVEWLNELGALASVVWSGLSAPAEEELDVSNFRRRYVLGGTFFFTLVTEQRKPILTTDLGRRTFRDAIE